MDLKDVISISGKGGLFKIVGKRPNGLIVEAMDGSKARTAITFTQKISLLDDIAMYTYAGEKRLLEIFADMAAAGNVPDNKADNEALKAFFEKVVPDYDQQRVYVSDIKKAVSWFHLLNGQMDFAALVEEAKKEETAAEADNKAEIKSKAKLTEAETEAKPRKTAAPKKAAPKANTKSDGGAKTTYRPKSV
jgi:hypothetical protein